MRVLSTDAGLRGSGRLFQTGLDPLQLSANGFCGLIGGLLKGFALALREQFLSRNHQFHFDDLVLPIVAIMFKSEEDLAAEDPIMELIQFMETLSDESHQFVVRIEMDGMYVHVHGPYLF